VNLPGTPVKLQNIYRYYWY